MKKELTVILILTLVAILIVTPVSGNSILSYNSKKDYKIENSASNDLKLNECRIKKSFEGYTLFTPWFSTKTYLINNSWKVVNKWRSFYQPALPVRLLENGNLLRGCYVFKPGIIWGSGDTGRVEMFNWSGSLIWFFEYVNETHCLHHDIEPLPNGNILMTAWEEKTRDEAIAAGCDPGYLIKKIVWLDHIIEVQPNGSDGGNIVWEWHVWDHMIQDYDLTKQNYGVVEDHPELIDINFMSRNSLADWNHINSIDYNEEFDQILLSANANSEIWIIDHSTTTQEAVGHSGGKSGKGGDLLYRWGNPQSYRAGNASNRKFYGQHDARWIESDCPGAGNITVFHNGFNQPGENYSSVIEIVPPVDENGTYFLELGSVYGPKEPAWIYTAKNPTRFYAPGQSGAQRLPNGNTLICNGPRGIIFEVTSNKKIVWLYFNFLVNPFNSGGNLIFKAFKYPLDYDGIGEISNVVVNDNSMAIEPNMNSILSGQSNEIQLKDIIYRFLDNNSFLKGWLWSFV